LIWQQRRQSLPDFVPRFYLGTRNHRYVVAL